jgi:hypothetical protein
MLQFGSINNDSKVILGPELLIFELPMHEKELLKSRNGTLKDEAPDL